MQNIIKIIKYNITVASDVRWLSEYSAAWYEHVLAWWSTENVLYALLDSCVLWLFGSNTCWMGTNALKLAMYMFYYQIPW